MKEGQFISVGLKEKWWEMDPSNILYVGDAGNHRVLSMASCTEDTVSLTYQGEFGLLHSFVDKSDNFKILRKTIKVERPWTLNNKPSGLIRVMTRGGHNGVLDLDALNFNDKEPKLFIYGFNRYYSLEEIFCEFMSFDGKTLGSVSWE